MLLLSCHQSQVGSGHLVSVQSPPGHLLQSRVTFNSPPPLIKLIPTGTNANLALFLTAKNVHIFKTREDFLLEELEMAQ